MPKGQRWQDGSTALESAAKRPTRPARGSPLYAMRGLGRCARDASFGAVDLEVACVRVLRLEPRPVASCGAVRRVDALGDDAFPAPLEREAVEPRACAALQRRRSQPVTLFESELLERSPAQGIRLADEVAPVDVQRVEAHEPDPRPR